jgi:hypothetical protein
MAAGVKSAAMWKLLLAAALAALTADASAWSREGHELVAELAERRLSPAARAEVARLLAGEPDPSLAGIAAWADDMRAESRTGVNELGERSERWHYLNFPRGTDCAYVPARDCPDGNCVVAAIAAQATILGDRSRTDLERAQALKFLVHFVGDVHEPMHAGFGDDRGGNNYPIQLRARTARDGDEGTNLHKVWDYHVLRSSGLAVDAYADMLQTRSAVDIGATPVLASASRDWAVESCRIIADTPLYPTGHVLKDDYLDRHRPLAERRVLQAAFRLAELLETALVPAR